MIYLKEFATQAEYDAFVASGQMQRPNVSYIQETMAVEYKKPIQYGVFIQHIDGTLLTKEQWQSKGYSNELANGVAIVDEKASFVIAKVDVIIKVTWGPAIWVNNVSYSTLESAATDYNGYANTERMINKASNMAKLCTEYIFPNNATGYVPAAGELYLVYSKYYSDVDACLAIIGERFNADFPIYWSSTEASHDKAWVFRIDTNVMEPYSKSLWNITTVRAFTKLNIE